MLLSSRVLGGTREDPDTAGAARFERLVRVHQDRVYGFCLRMVSNPDDALELTQETFESVYLHLGEFRHDAQLSTWILKIARNLSLNRLRYWSRHGGRAEPLHELGDEALGVDGERPGTPHDALEAAGERAQVQRAIAQLDEEQRALVVLRDIEGLAYSEIAQVMDLPEGTVKSRLHRARERLAHLLSMSAERGAR
jgi:RNA polymerase sigma-70 factor (ECF subfamily)